MISEYSHLGRTFLEQCSEDSGFQEYDVPQQMIEEIGRRIHQNIIHDGHNLINVNNYRKKHTFKYV